MDEETRKAFQTINNKLSDIEKSCLHSESEILELKSQVSINCTKLDSFGVKLDNMPLKIKQELLPQLITEVRNCVRDEITKKF